MELVYIYHSGFAIQGKDFSILIDYYKDTPGKWVQDELINRPGRLYVLASHSHADHFNPEILQWRNQRPDIQYLFSEDIREEGKACYHDAAFLKKGESWNDDLLRVKAFGSTDLGISFLLNTDNRKIFHAGDLNNWHWAEESTPEEIEEAETNYLRELETLAQETDHLNLALFPIDPRLGNDYAKGARQFLRRIHTDIMAPMHFWEKYDAAHAFLPEAERWNSRFISWTHPGESITF